MTCVYEESMRHKKLLARSLPCGRGPKPALDFEGVELENRENVASEIIKYTSMSQTVGDVDKADILEYRWNLREDCPGLTIVPKRYRYTPAST